MKSMNRTADKKKSSRLLATAADCQVKDLQTVYYFITGICILQEGSE